MILYILVINFLDTEWSSKLRSFKLGILISLKAFPIKPVIPCAKICKPNLHNNKYEFLICF